MTDNTPLVRPSLLLLVLILINTNNATLAETGNHRTELSNIEGIRVIQLCVVDRNFALFLFIVSPNS